MREWAAATCWVAAAVGTHIFGVFFVLPGAALFAQSLFGNTSAEVLMAEDNVQLLKDAERAVQEQDLIIE